MNDLTSSAPDADLRHLYRAGAAAAIGVLALVLFQIVVFVLWPPPATVAGWFGLFDRSRLVGLLDLDLLMIVDNVLIGLLFMAVLAAVRRTNRTLAVITLVVEAVAITTYFASNPAFEMLSLHRQYAAAATDLERFTALAAGQAMIATWQGSAFVVSYLLGALAILLTSAAMLRSQVFSRASAQVGFVFGALSLVPASAGKVGLVFSLLSLVPMWIWLALLARRLFQLARGPDAKTPERRPETGPLGQTPLPQS